jgi:hypothetical protein
MVPVGSRGVSLAFYEVQGISIMPVGGGATWLVLGARGGTTLPFQGAGALVAETIGGKRGLRGRAWPNPYNLAHGGERLPRDHGAPSGAALELQGFIRASGVFPGVGPGFLDDVLWGIKGVRLHKPGP